MSDFEVSCDKESYIVGRNGTFPICAVSITHCEEPNVVYIDGISSSRRTAINGGLCVDAKAMDELCKAWTKIHRKKRP